MRISLYLNYKIFNFDLPYEVSGSFSFDVDDNEENKLINVDAHEDGWYLYQTDSVKILTNKGYISSIKIMPDSFYILLKDNVQYMIYTNLIAFRDMKIFQIKGNLNILLGNNSSSNVYYNCEYLKELQIQITKQNNNILVKSNGKTAIYRNNNSTNNTDIILGNGDEIEIFGLRIFFIGNLVMFSNCGDRINVLPNSGLVKKMITIEQRPSNEEIKDIDLVSKDDFFSKTPRIRRRITTLEFNFDKPPSIKDGEGQKLPLWLSIGPMLSSTASSALTVVNLLTQLAFGQVTLAQCWPSLITCTLMFASMFIWPSLIAKYNKKMQEEQNEYVIEKYTEYLEMKKKELREESKTQSVILFENLISVDECIKNIHNKGFGFWDKRIDQNDFLVVRTGLGRVPLDIKVNWPSEGFSIEQSNLKQQAEDVLRFFQYLDDVPVGYSFFYNKVTAVMGTEEQSRVFMNNVVAQLLSFYSYDDLKFVVITNKENTEHWEYFKYLYHTFNNSKTFRFYGDDSESIKKLTEVLNAEAMNRIQNKNASTRPHYFVIIDDYEKVKYSNFVKCISESGGNIGMNMVILAKRMAELPSKCENFITLGNKKSDIMIHAYEEQIQSSFNDELNHDLDMMSLVKDLSNVPIAFEDAMMQLPDAITFLEMEKVGKVEQLNIVNRWKTNDSTRSLAAEVGVDQNGETLSLDLHEKYHGPHGLIAGMTGSGKSEFIITYVLSMCMNYSPDDVAFILIDYKGGGLAGAFENKTTNVYLPHLAGTITNLDKAEMDRTLVSINSELQTRQRMFNEARDKLGESTIDIYKYQKFFKEGKLDTPIPHLFLICDEFAELKAQQPDFMDSLISTARIGRSLGVHLILATQKPSGVVNDQIWSNTKFRVCLKVQDGSDSREMIRRPDAASLKQAGRFYLQVGYDEYFVLGQSGWCGAKYFPSDKVVKNINKSIDFIDSCGIRIKSIQASGAKRGEAQGEQISAILRSIIDVAAQQGKMAKRLWLPNIDSDITIKYEEDKYNVEYNDFIPMAIIGEYDAPEVQKQGVVTYDFIKGGNAVLYGQDGTEREMFLMSFIYSVCSKYDASSINMYLMDFGSETLRCYMKLPQFGGMVFQEEEEKYTNLIKLLNRELNKRKKKLVDYGGEYSNYVRQGNKDMPVICMMFNNFDSIKDSYSDLVEILPGMTRDSERYGIVFWFNGSATNSVPSKIVNNCHTFYALRLKDASDYSSIFGVRGRISPRDIVGRGVIKDGKTMHEFQTVKIDNDEVKQSDIIYNFVIDKDKNAVTRAVQIPTLPTHVRFDNISDGKIEVNDIPVGLSKRTLDIVNINITQAPGYLITANKIINANNFIFSFISILKSIPNYNIVIVDGNGDLLEEGKVKIESNYYKDNLHMVIEKLTEYLNEIVEKASSQSGIIMLYGLKKINEKVDDKKLFEQFINAVKKCEAYRLIIAEDASKVKSVAYESWYTGLLAQGEGIYVGRGVADQSVIRIPNISRDMNRDIPNDMGYVIIDGEAILVRLVDFITSDEEDAENEE